MRRNALIVLMSVELMLNAANLTLVAFGRSYHDSHAHSFAFVVMAVAAAEATFVSFWLHRGRHLPQPPQRERRRAHAR